ncbi:hypothetical protein F5Y05DRAFT_423555 [Hypoxylon sp. FL0543]|nr:hypothetical protein F5Y05DRAFT_423555 [Hypoxylon sp. FL0543]
MGRKKNRNRQPKTHANNKSGPRTVRFDDDHFMQGANPSPTKSRYPPNSRGGKNPFQPHGRTGPPWYAGNKASNHNRNRSQASNPHNNTNNFPGTNHSRNRKNRQRETTIISDETDTDFDLDFDLDTLISQAPTSTSSRPNRPHSNTNTNTNTNNTNNSNPRARFCTECSAVRRANLRFRNWAAGALQRCGEHLAAWAEDAGVAFGAADEMDWQPEPVIRVVLLGPGNGFGFDGESQARREEALRQQQQQQEYRRQQEQYQQSVGNIGPVPTPGPWAWPPYREPATGEPIAWPVRVPMFGLPALPVLEPDCANTTTTTPATAAGIDNGHGSSAMPTSGFGIVGAGAGGERTSSPCPGCDEGRARAQVAIPSRGPMEQPGVTSTCGPTLRTGGPSGTRRRSSSEGAFLSCCA